MQIVTYLTFDGRCEAAFKFYADCLGGKIEAMIPHAGTHSAEHVPAEWQNKIMHASLAVGGQQLMGSDAPPAHYQRTQGMSVSLHLSDPAEAARIFTALASEGTVNMPLQPTPLARSFGMLVDQFGIPWMINCA